MERQDERVARLNHLEAADREHLVRVVGEAAIDLWSMGATWPDLVERCLELVEEDAAAGYVRVHVDASSHASDADAASQGA